GGARPADAEGAAGEGPLCRGDRRRHDPHRRGRADAAGGRGARLPAAALARGSRPGDPRRLNGDGPYFSHLRKNRVRPYFLFESFCWMPRFVSSTEAANGPPSAAARSITGSASESRPWSESVWARLLSTITDSGLSRAALRSTVSASRSSPSAWWLLARPTAALTFAGQRLRKVS